MANLGVNAKNIITIYNESHMVINMKTFALRFCIGIGSSTGLPAGPGVLFQLKEKEGWVEGRGQSCFENPFTSARLL